MSGKKATKQVVTTVSTVPVDFDNEWALFTLLYDHPIFQKGVRDARKKLGIPEGGFTSQQVGFAWELADPKRRGRFRTLVADLLSGFNIPGVYRPVAAEFAEQFTLCAKSKIYGLLSENRVDPVLWEDIKSAYSRTIPALRKIVASDDPKVNAYLFRPGMTYLEITENTTQDDINDFWKSHKKGDKSKRVDLPKVNLLARHCWRNKDMGDANIARVISQIHKEYGYMDVAKLRALYKKALLKIRRFP